MRNYELTVILKDEKSTRVAELIKKLKVVVVKSEPAEKRAFAYPIKKLASGFYCFYELEMDPATVLDLDKELRLDENVIRHLIVVKNVKKVEKVEKSKKSKK